MKTIEEVFAWALAQVVGRDLVSSGLGNIWRDEYVWRDMAKRVMRQVVNGNLVILHRTAYDELVKDAKQMRVVRARIAEYKAFKTKDGP